MILRNLEMPRLLCNLCGYEWTPRTLAPKKCPDCGSRHWNDEETVFHVTSLREKVLV